MLRLRDTSGQPVSGTVLVSGPSDTASYEVQGESTIDESEVGNFALTATSPGYESVYIQAVLTPPEPVIPLVLRKLAGRPTE